jgi:hypothetical protein
VLNSSRPDFNRAKNQKKGSTIIMWSSSSSTSSLSSLKDVLEYLLQQDEKFKFLWDLMGQDYLALTQVYEVAQDGKTLGELEHHFQVSDLNKVQQTSFRTFIRTYCEWSKRGHKRPRIEESHSRFSQIGAPSTFGKNSSGGWPEKQMVPSLEIMCSRPAKSSWINVLIMHPVFARMADALREKSIPDPSDFQLARLLTQAMPSSYVA